MGGKRTLRGRSGLNGRHASKSWVHVGIKEGTPGIPSSIVASIPSSIPLGTQGYTLSSSPGESRWEDTRLDGNRDGGP